MSTPSKEIGFDIIGDVHGCARTLRALLEKLGYSKQGGVYKHKSRQALFVGDIVDRGPRIRESLHIVRDMVEQGSAQMVMGNHEYNALGYCTRARPGSSKTYLREHNPRHERLIRETLEQFADYGREWNEFLDWFLTLPVFLEFDHLRVVHACWDQAMITEFKAKYHCNSINEDFLHASTVRGSFAGHFMNRLLRGTDMLLPDGLSMTAKDGFVRTFFRTNFWTEDPQTYDDVIFQPDGLPEEIAHRPLSQSEKDSLIYYSKEERPLFIGHYWLSGIPAPLRDNLVCLDYSAVKYGKLVAYRLDDEKTLSSDKFVWVDVTKEA